MSTSYALMLKEIASPGNLQREFFSYLEAAQVPFDNSKTIAPVAYYDMKTIESKESVKLFQTDGAFDSNTTNVNGNNYQLEQSAHAVFHSIRLQDGSDGTLTDTDWENAITLSRLKNAKMTISINGVRALRDYPLNEALDGLTTGDVGIIKLPNLLIWPAQTELEIELDLVLAGEQDQNIKATLIGMGFV